MTPVLLLSLLVVEAPAVGPPAATAPDMLVRQLGSENYAIRSAAERRLLALGAAAVPAVEAGRRHDDLEVRRRCQEVLRRLRAAVCAERVKALRAGRAESDAPLWGHYRRMLGSGRAATALFAEVYQSESDLLEEAGAALRRGDRGELVRLLSQQVRLLAATFADETAGRRDPPGLQAEFTHRLCAALLLAALPGAELDAAGWASFSRMLMETVSFRRSASSRQELRELIGWASLGAHGEGAALHALRQALLHKLAGPARRVARRALAAERPVVLSTAAYALGRFGEAEDIARLLPLLKNEAELPMHNHSDHSTAGEVSDFALEALVRLTGQRPADYAIDPSVFMSAGYV